jgi:DNA modification methylase
MKQQVKITQVKGNPNNPRIIKNDKFKKLVKSIQDFPEMLKLRPIVVDEDMMVLGGNMRLKASKDAGLKEVWIEIAEGLTEEQKKEFIVKDNVGFGEWEWDMLANEWDSVQLAEWGLDVWENEDDKEPEAGLIEDDEIPEVKESKVKRGDIWQLGEHRLMCGDNMNLMKQYEDNYFDLAIDDPPYGINQDATQEKLANKKGFNKQAGTYKKYHEQKWDSKIPSKNYFNNLTNICKNHIVWGGNYFCELKDTGIIIWYKGNSGNFKEGELAKTNLNVFKVFQYSRADAYINDCENKVHPTQKPIKLYLWLINEFSKKGDKILDCHLGSGSTLIACEKTNRICYGMELDEKYCDVIIERWEQFTGQKAIKNGTK